MPSFIQNVASYPGGTGATRTMTVGSGITTTAGNTLSLWVRGASGNNIVSVSDTKGNLWQLDRASTSTKSCSSLASCHITTPIVHGDVITVTLSISTADSEGGCAEFSGIAKTAAGYPATGQTNEVANLSTGPVTVATLGASADPVSLVISGAACSANAGTFTVTAADPDSGGTWTQLNYPGSGADAAYQIASASSLFSCTWTPASSTNADASIATYKSVPVISTTTLAEGSLGTYYFQSLVGANGVGSYTWAIATGGLPPGLALQASTGVISGVPVAGGVYIITVQLTDAGGNVAVSGDIVITVSPGFLFLPGNILSPQDSDFEDPLAVPTWAAETNAGAPSVIASDSFTGDQCLQWASVSGGLTQIHTGMYPVKAGLPYIASLWLKPAIVADCYIGFEWYNASNTLLSTTTSADNTSLGNEWQPMEIASVAPTGATQVSIFAQVGESTAGDIEEIDLCYLAQSKTQVLIDWFNSVYSPGSLAGQSWMDVSPFVRYDTGITLQSGRQDAISEIQPGSATFILQNDSGLFTRYNMNSAIVANGGSIDNQSRFQVNLSDEHGNWWTRFDGVISEIDYQGDNTGNTNQASINGTDVLAYLNRQGSLSCWTKSQVLNDGPSYHWTLDDEGNNLGLGVAAETSGNNGPPLRLIQGGANAGATLTWQDSSGGVETLADSVAAGHPDGSEYWLPGQIQPSSPIRGLDSGAVGAFTVALPGIGSLGATTSPSIPLPSITVQPALVAQSAQNTYLGNTGYYLQAQLPQPIAPSAAGNDFAVEIWFTQDPTVLTDQASNYGPYVPISLGNSRTQSCIVTGIFLPDDFGAGYYPNPPAWSGRNFAGSGVLTSTWTSIPPHTLDSVRRPHHLVLNFKGDVLNPTVSVWLDGNEIVGPNVIDAGEVFDIITVGAAYGGGGAWYGNLSLVSVYPYRLPSSTITTHCQLGQYGMWEMTTDDCIAQLAEYASVPAFWNNVGTQHTGLTLTDYQDITGSTPISAMQQFYEATEMGLIFVDHGGRLNFHTRDWRMGYGAPDLMLPPGVFDANMGLELIDQFQVNQQAVNTNSFSAGVAYTNTDSQDRYGTYAVNGIGSPNTLPLISWSRSFAQLGVNGYGLWGDPSLSDYCAWVANSRGDSWLLPGTLKVDLLTIENDPLINLARSSFFPLEIDNMIAPTGTMPQSFPNKTGSAEWFIEGINETISIHEHSLTFYCSPATDQRAWKPGDATYGQLGSTARIGISSPDLSTPQADGKDVSHDAGPPYWTPTFQSGMNNPAANGHGFVGMNDIRGLVSNLQNAIKPPIAAVGAFTQVQSIPSGPTSSPEIFWDTLYTDTASSMGIIPGWPNWYVCTVPGWYEIDAQLVWELSSTLGGQAEMGWIIVAQQAAQAVAAGTGTPLTVNQYVCPVGESQRRNTASINTVCAPTTRLYLGLGDMVTLGAEQDSGANWNTGTDFGSSYLSIRFLGLGTQGDRVQVNTSLANGGSVITPPVVTKNSVAFTNTATYSYWGATAVTNTAYGLRDTNGAVYQGVAPNQWTITGSQFGQVVFNVTAIRTALTGLTVTGLTLTCQDQFTYYKTGSILQVGYFVDTPGGSTWIPGNNSGNVRSITTSSFNSGQTKTFSLPLTISDALLSSANGLFIGDDASNQGKYNGFWAGGAGAWTLTFHTHS